MEAPQRFADRREAGSRLADALQDVRDAEPVVFGIPRGGVVVGQEVGAGLGCPLEVLVVRKLGYPGHEEAGFGAVGEECRSWQRYSGPDGSRQQVPLDGIAEIERQF